MASVLNAAHWQTVRFIDIFHVQSGAPGTKSNYFGHTDLYQLAFKIRGETAIVYDGKPLAFVPESVIYLPKETRPDVEYRKKIVTTGSSICMFFDAPLPLYPDAFALSPPNPALKELFHKLLHLWRSGKNDFLLFGTFFELLSHIEAALCAPEFLPDFIGKATGYIVSHACDAFTDFDALAAQFGMSADRFRRVFRENVGLSPLAFLAGAKTDKIKALLRENRYSLTEIAALTGFSDLNYFSRFFKKHTGLSASEYRKKYCEPL